MSARPFRIEPLQGHDRKSFDCGVSDLNAYFHNQVGQDIRRHVTACYVAVDQTTERIAGYYTLSMGGVQLGDLPKKTAKRLPRYPQVPVVRLGRLAVDLRYRGQRLGASLLADAVGKSLSSEIAAYAIVVDAKDDSAAAFYEHHGFIKLSHDPRTLFLPLGDVLKKLLLP